MLLCSLSIACPCQFVRLPAVRCGHQRLQNAHRAEVEAILARAQAQVSKTGEGKMTLEHMVLALAENPR